MKIQITIESREDGGLRVYSDDVPGLVLSGADPELVMADVWPALQIILAYTSGEGRLRGELLAHVAKAICRVLLNGGDPNQPAVRWNGTQMEPQEFPAWRDFRDEAVAAIGAYDEYDWRQRRGVESDKGAGDDQGRAGVSNS